jgi:predicted DNA-binding protein
MGYGAVVSTKSKPIPIRLDTDFIDRLDTVSDKIGSNRAAVIRFCVITFVEYLEKHGRAVLPPDWKELMARSDRRTKASRSKQRRGGR